MIIDLSLSIISFGVVKNTDKELIARQFIELLKSQNLNPDYAKNTDLDYILKEGMYDWKGHWGRDYQFGCNFTPHWGNTKEVYSGADIYFYSNSNQHYIRINLLPDMVVKSRTDYDDFAQEACKLAKVIHQQNKSVITIVDRNTTTLGSSPYNLKTLPMWVGWYSVYNEDVVNNNKLQSIPTDLQDLEYANEKDISILRCTKPWSEYKRSGWDEPSKKYLLSLGVKLLKRGSKK